ncbi:MAG: antitoxin HicB [Defluviitaleaceae bacterium]|nr:antitoxin HicB [Defluviitaleaceae bacterium]
MNNTLEYKGFVGTIEYCDEDKIYFGRVHGFPKTMISYHGDDLTSLKADFIEAVEFHLLPNESEVMSYQLTQQAV